MYTFDSFVKDLAFLTSLGSIQPLHMIKCQAHKSKLPPLLIAKYPFIALWSEVVGTGGFAKFFHAMIGINARNLESEV